jgi:uncharacterized protein YbjT (DUF2867 family)
MIIVTRMMPEQAECYNYGLMILVTGGTGFVGQALIRHLAALGLPVRTLLRPSQKSPKLPRGVPVEVAVSSLRDERSLRSAFKDVDIVVHLAGAERMGSRADLEDVDVEGTRILSRVAAQAGIRRLVYLSHLGADRESAFAVFKAKGLAETLIIQSGVPFTIVRSAVIFGQNDQFTMSLSRLLRLAPGFVLLPGKGETLLQPIFVDDLTACLGMLLDKPDFDRQITNVGGGEYLSYRQVVEMVMQKSHHRRLLVPISPPYLRSISLLLEQTFAHFPISIFWLDYLAADRICALDTLPRVFGIIPVRLSNQMDYLSPGFLR